MALTKNKDLLLIPGPTPVSDEVYDALAFETYSHTDPRFVASYSNALAMTKELFNCHDGEVYVVAGSGTLSMEMALVNTVKPGERILVLTHGYFGDRFIQLAKAFDIEADVLSAEWGQHVCLNKLRQTLAEKQYKAVTVTHVDTSTGVEADLDMLVPIIKASGALLILDGVCATAAIAEDMGKSYANDPHNKIDIVLTGSQKAIGVPPGLAIVAFGPKALQARHELGNIKAYYADINNWRPIMENPNKYFATPAINMIYGYEAGLKLVMAEGLKARYARHTKVAQALVKALAVYGLKPLASAGHRASTLTCILYPEGINDAKFRNDLAEENMVVAGALGPVAGKAFRFGHMGNTTVSMLERAIELIAQALNKQGYEADAQSALAEFHKNLA